ncbi:glycoside hydrolase family 43 protein [Duganella sp. LjRoot269]|jgi:beta-xylosidase|uniref:glycoside hydrolase family 43 protein n=1 Tax=Duganella sp. LjRoot269 TaxID=3342305 RepID=UPI003ED0C084
MIKRAAVAAGAAALLTAAGAQAANPLFPKLFTADPSAYVDNGTVYLYVGHDEAASKGRDYLMKEWRVYSSCDMKNWTDRGSPLQASTFKWAKGQAWAADVTKRDGKYYFYSTVDHATIPGFAIGVAVSDSPTGPFVDARGSALVTNDMTRQTAITWDDIDPAIFQDDDGQAYLYWGNTVLKYAKLKPNMTELDGPIQTVGMDMFTEASYLHKHNGTYYLSYSRNFPEETAYMTGPSATGPWQYRGTIMSKNAKVKTIHQAIIDFNGKSYIFYHNAKLPGGGEYRRSVAVEEFAYNADGTIPFIKQTAEGPAANPSPACK